MPGPSIFAVAPFVTLLDFFIFVVDMLRFVLPLDNFRALAKWLNGGRDDAVVVPPENAISVCDHDVSDEEDIGR